MQKVIYPTAVQQNSVLGQTARGVVVRRYKRYDWKSHDSLDTNFAAATLVFEDGTTITEAAIAGGHPPWGHSEARSLVNAIEKAIDLGKSEFTDQQKRMPATGDATQLHFDSWQSSLIKLKKIIIYSDRSCCPDCNKFFTSLLAGIPHEIGYDVEYRRGFAGSLSNDLDSAKPIVRERQNQYAIFSEAIIKQREEIEGKLNTALEFSEGMINVQEFIATLRTEYLEKLKEKTEAFNEMFFVRDDTLPGLNITSTEQQDFEEIKKIQILELEKNINKLVALAKNRQDELDQLVLNLEEPVSSSQDTKRALSSPDSSPPHKAARAASDNTDYSEKLTSLQTEFSSQSENLASSSTTSRPLTMQFQVAQEHKQPSSEIEELADDNKKEVSNDSNTSPKI